MMMPFRMIGIVFLFLLAAACITRGQSSRANATGISGVITVGPTRPGPSRAGELPDRGPFADITFVVRSENATVASFTTDGQGRFQISVPPGHYTVSPKDWDGGPGRCGPFEVDVAMGKMTNVEWRCSSGMR
jgi:hypothetical protein